MQNKCTPGWVQMDRNVIQEAKVRLGHWQFSIRSESHYVVEQF